MYAIVENNEIKQFVSGDTYKNISFGSSATIEDRQNAGLYHIIDDEPELTKYQMLGNESYIIDDTAQTVTKAYEIIELDPVEIDRKEFKIERQAAINNLEVIYNEVIYQGDETSQSRMGRKILAMSDTDAIDWVAKDNSIHELSKADLQEILRLAGQMQSEIWVQ